MVQLALVLPGLQVSNEWMGATYFILSPNDSMWGRLQVAETASLPPHRKFSTVHMIRTGAQF